MAIEIVPEWMRNLEEEDVVFLKKFVLAFRFFKRNRLSIWSDLSYRTASSGSSDPKNQDGGKSAGRSLYFAD